MSRITITPSDQAAYDRKVLEWGEKGAAHNISHTPVTPDNRSTITLSGSQGNIAANSTERQKQRSGWS